MRRFLRRLLRLDQCPAGGDHEFVNTGASYTDQVHGFTVVLKHCVKCDLYLIVEV